MLKKYLVLVLGFLIVSYGVSLAVHVSYIGIEPWVAVNVGLSDLSLTYGIWNALIQTIFIVFTVLLERRVPRLGTFLNMTLLSSFTDFFIFLDYLPKIPEGTYSYLFFVLAIFVTSIGMSFIIATGLGAGAKTQFYVTVHHKYGIKLSHAKMSLEILGLILALMVGGPIFIGTIIVAILSGYFIGFFTPLFQNRLFPIETNQENLEL